MKFSKYLIATLFSASMLFACDNKQTSEESTIVMEEEAPLESPAATERAEEGAEQIAQDPNVQVVEVVAENLQFSPNEIRVKPEQRLQIVLTNKGDVPYSIKFELPKGAQELRNPVDPGRKAGLIFTTPKKAGTYPFYSPLQQQRGRGMTGKLIVE